MLENVTSAVANAPRSPRQIAAIRTQLAALDRQDALRFREN